MKAREREILIEVEKMGFEKWKSVLEAVKSCRF